MSKLETKTNNTPTLRFPEFSGEWKEKRLGEIADFWNGKAHEQDISAKGDFIVVNSKFVSTEGRIRKFSNRQISPLIKDDIVMVMSDIPNGKAIAKCFLIDENNRYTLNQRIGGIRGKYVENRFLIRILNRNHFLLRHDNGVSQTNLRKEEILRCPLWIPITAEQQKIAYFLTSIDDWIENLKKQKEAQEKYKKGMMQKIFSQVIRFKDENGDDYPEWEEKRLGEITSNFDSKRQPIAKEKRKPGKYPYYGANGIVDNVEEYLFDGEFVLVAEDGVVDVSRYPVHLAKGKFWVNNHAHVLQGKDVGNIFLYYALQNIRFARYITGSAQTKLNSQVLSKMLVAIPTGYEQQKIADFLSSIDDLINLSTQRINLAEEWKKGVMQRVFV